MKKNFYISTLLFFLPLICTGQYSNLNFFHLTRLDGLSDNSITSIIKDSQGYMWFGTSNGLNRYDGYEFIKYFRENDNSSVKDNEIHSLFLSSTGELWIAYSSKGISRYWEKADTFEHFSFSGEDHTEAANMISGITEDKDSVIFVSSMEGVYFLEKERAHFKALPVAVNNPDNPEYQENKLLHPNVTGITADEEEGVWILYDDWRLSHYNHKTKTYRHFDLRDQRNPNQFSTINRILHLNGKIWIGGIGTRLLCFDPLTSQLQKLLRDAPIYQVSHIRPSPGGNLWISGSSGLIHYNVLTEDYQRYTNINLDNRSLSSTAISCSYEDTTGVIWAGTATTGLNYTFPGKQFRHMYTGVDDYYNLSGKDVTSILHTSSGDMWVGFQDGNIEYHDSSIKQKFYFRPAALTDNNPPGRIFKLYEGRNGDILCASWQGGVQVFDRNNNRFRPLTGNSQSFLEVFENNDVRDIESDSRGNLWIANHGKGVYIYNRRNKTIKKVQASADSASLTSNWVYDICFDTDNNIWVTSSYGLTRINNSTGEITEYYHSNDNGSISHNSTEIVKTDREGNLWLIAEGTLNLYNPVKNSFNKFRPGIGYENIRFRSIIQDNSGKYWAGTTQGIVSFDLRENSEGRPVFVNIDHFDIYDGLQSGHFYANSTSIDTEGTIFFGGEKGIDFFKPSEINPVPVEPLLRIRNIRIMEKGSRVPTTVYLSPEKELILNYNQNMVGIEYTSLNYFHDNNNIFSFKLDPITPEWTEVGKNRDILFSNLDPGDYSLSLRVKTKSAQTEIAENILRFYIKPPFWDTPWFKALMILFLLLTGLFILMLYTRQLRKRQAWLEYEVQQRTSQLNQKNNELQERSRELTKSNILLKKRQNQIRSQAKELEAQSSFLEKANNELNKLNEMKDRFLSIIAHDLRNPFNTLLGFSELLINDYEKYTDKRRKELLAIIHHSAAGSRNLLENLLSWSMAQNETLTVSTHSIPVQQILDEILYLVNPMVHRKNIDIEIIAEDNLEVWADPDLLKTILRNLVSNAVKFTPKEGKIKITAKRVEHSNVMFTVIDNGVGMLPEKAGNLFNQETQSQTQGTSGEKGSGLGLVLVKEFVHLLKGNITAESEKGKGTRIYLSLPAHNSELHH